MRTIGVLTSGGDAPGMNAAIRATVRCALSEGMEVYGIERGYEGLITGQFEKLDSRSVSDRIQRGGTFLKTARCPEFLQKETRKKAFDIIQAYGIEGLVIIGGDGSYRGMKDLYDDFGVPGMCIPGTIDNDLSYTDYTLGFDSAVNTVLWAINNLRDTMTSHDRVCIVEVMGRKCGDIAVYAGLAGGAEMMLVPEMPVDYDLVAKRILQNKLKGKNSDIIVLAEGVCDASALSAILKEKTGISLRTVNLGHIQRGGTPTMADRVLAARCAERAVSLLKNDVKDARAIGIRDNAIIDMNLSEALNMPRVFNEALYNLANKLGK